ncbi:hypothetical protein BCR34DRAFT_599859 [Clohesyomyces aquaticus]|uniref:C2H2-type domain-containing protein n=1 Tax=Clohesyomyces aquaticus TaxID=1231657 RepID=A0A1Y1ZTF1_9PLEO|nr:hypothetical protein BCR34DRAFT_599859 [Clohesyomyces aquaticus]
MSAFHRDQPSSKDETAFTVSDADGHHNPFVWPSDTRRPGPGFESQPHEARQHVRVGHPQHQQESLYPPGPGHPSNSHTFPDQWPIYPSVDEEPWSTENLRGQNTRNQTFALGTSYESEPLGVTEATSSRPSIDNRSDYNNMTGSSCSGGNGMEPLSNSITALRNENGATGLSSLGGLVRTNNSNQGRRFGSNESSRQYTKAFHAEMDINFGFDRGPVQSGLENASAFVTQGRPYSSAKHDQTYLDAPNRSLSFDHPSPASEKVPTSPSFPDPMSCLVKGCDSQFSGPYRKGNRARHVRIKHGHRVFTCDYCQKDFHRGDARLKHIRRCHPGKVGDPIRRKGHTPTKQETSDDVPEEQWQHDTSDFPSHPDHMTADYDFSFFSG